MKIRNDLKFDTAELGARASTRLGSPVYVNYRPAQTLDGTPIDADIELRYQDTHELVELTRAEIEALAVETPETPTAEVTAEEIDDAKTIADLKEILRRLIGA